MRTTILIATVLASTMVQSAQAQAPRPTTPVEVTNTASNPVPVTGNLAVTGNANVAVTNDGSSPVPVTVLNPYDPTLNAFQIPIFFHVGGQTNFTVPDGKRLVMESVSFAANMAPGQKPRVFVQFTVDNNISEAHLPAMFAGHDSVNNRDIFMGMHSTLFFADPGTTVYVHCQPIEVLTDTHCILDMNLSGHLVPTS